MPNLNTRPYLPERFQSIFNQTFQDWELIVCDSYSDDGSWEYIQELAEHEPRMRISQTPKNGIYAGFNDCIKLARGEYVYIATSDDTMYPDCLEKMAAALEANPECGICQCRLEIIDENSKTHPQLCWDNYALGRFAPDWIKRTHIRRAPLDGILHFALQTIYTSLTQLLIRRRVFDRVGLFDRGWGSKGDFEWDVRVGLLEDCVFIPDKLATWRIHPQQATGKTESSAARREMLAMVRAAFERAQQVPGNKIAQLPLNRLLRFYREQIVSFGLCEAGNRRQYISFLAAEIFRGNMSALEYVFKRIRKKKFDEPTQFDQLRALLAQIPIPTPLVLNSQ